jgi:hypothetical protein
MMPLRSRAVEQKTLSSPLRMAVRRLSGPAILQTANILGEPEHPAFCCMQHAPHV